MQLHKLNPLTDARWKDFVGQHPQATVFHQPAWLAALNRTYGYEPLVVTSSAPHEPLRDGLVLCRVSSWITGTRLVSLPFADHCQPLLDANQDVREFSRQLEAECDRRQWRYVEFRPLTPELNRASGVEPCASFWLHRLDLSPSLDQLYARLHKNSFRRKIRRAQREGLVYEVGRSERFANEFYRLLIATRRRHHLLPQPRTWFKNLVECMGDCAEIRLARKDGIAIAAMLSLRNKSSVVYKYGCSDAQFHRFGGMPMLFWKLIEESKAAGADDIDLGRCELDHTGLIIFKDRLGATKTRINYYRYTNAKVSSPKAASRMLSSWTEIFDLPDTVLSTAGRVLYRHFG